MAGSKGLRLSFILDKKGDYRQKQSYLGKSRARGYVQQTYSGHVRREEVEGISRRPGDQKTERVT